MPKKLESLIVITTRFKFAWRVSIGQPIILVWSSGINGQLEALDIHGSMGTDGKRSACLRTEQSTTLQDERRWWVDQKISQILEPELQEV
jgi:hypothetical protein